MIFFLPTLPKLPISWRVSSAHFLKLTVATQGRCQQSPEIYLQMESAAGRRNTTISCPICGSEDKRFRMKPWFSRVVQPKVRAAGTACSPAHESAPGLTEPPDVLNSLIQTQHNWPSAQALGSQKYLMGCECGWAEFIPGIMTEGGRHSFLLLSRKSASSFLDGGLALR